jgi:hypothetical protein
VACRESLAHDAYTRMLPVYEELVTNIPAIEEFTCYGCAGLEQGCRYSFDLYNMDGDCLAEK